MKYPLGYNTWNKEEKKSAIKVLDSGFFTMGKKVKEFEEKFAKNFGSKYATMVNSGSSANLLMLSVLKNYKKIIKKKTNKPNIIAPSVGWSTSYYPISQNNFEINFVDVSIDTLNIDPEEVEKAIDKNTVAILAINLLGNPCNFSQLKKIAKKNNLILIEDNCESLGAKYQNKFCGTHGLMGTHSLFFSHHMQTMEGGVILTDNKDINDFLKSLRAHGWCRDLPKKNNLYKKSNDKFKDHFVFITPGYSLRPLEIEASVGLVQLKKLNRFMKIREKNSNIFKNLFGNKSWCKIQQQEKKSLSSWYGFNLILTGQLKNKRKIIIENLQKNKIEVRPTMTGNFLNNPVLKFLNFKASGSFKNSENIDKNGFFVGNYPKDLSKELNFLYKKLEEEIH
ncbi:DegT/DnrJ/EryC1/StrS family aminotransferase [Candidatus Pelagibacter sp.]|jgi:dTDP-4-amino-4,6-dideoxygalactose transaminase|nr:DegT/DnrJ/EryC1/StrS family aminotransferase [Candidatus Pelagibacter sp.]